MNPSPPDMPASCTTINNIDPDCVVDLYNITYIPQADPSNQSTPALGVAGFLEEYPGLDYIHDFLSTFSPRRNATGFTPDYNFTMVSINGGGTDDQGTGGEANLDMAYTMPFVQPLAVTYYSTGGRGPYVDDDGADASSNRSINEPWVPFLEHLLAQDAVPPVLSISYTDDEQAVPRAYARRVCGLFMQLASRGVSVLAASGDGGAEGTGTSQAGCFANDGGRNRTQFIPTFPAGCPYVTSVGATAAYSRTTAADFSSGGFSNYFARPAWQESAAGGYISALNGSHAGWYNASGRGIPDVSAVGSRIAIGPGGIHTKGTSASTPIVASMIALVNERRRRAGKPALGFLNPLLYSGQVDGAFTDCTEGSGGSCSYGDQVETGFDALPGWDAVTGLGTINLGNMMELVA